MRTRDRTVLASAICLLLAWAAACAPVAAGETIEFTEDRWALDNARLVDYLGRKCLIGVAYVKNFEFQDGVIEVDVAVTGAPSYPGVNFRLQSVQDGESFYLRPHRAGLYPDALQYTPIFNGVSSWQLYSGNGCTAGAAIPRGQWVHVRLEVSGKRARVFLDDATSPALVIDDLKHGVSKGTVGLSGPPDGSAYFANFSCRADDRLDFGPVPWMDTPPGLLTHWELSPAIPLSRIDLERSPADQGLGEVAWQRVESAPSGLVDIARYVGRLGTEPDCVLARTTIAADEERVLPLRFGYSDVVSIFLNGRILFLGNSAYRQRDPSFLGIVGLNDTVYLPLVKGENELLLAVAESFGGWGFIAQDGSAGFVGPGVAQVFETNREFLTPESVIYDAVRGVLYVSNFDAYNTAAAAGGQFLSRVSTDGAILERQWIAGLSRPAGLVIAGNTLYVVERGALVEVDLASGAVVKRRPVPGALFLNDVAVDRSGTLYLSDTEGDAIYRLADDAVEQWLRGGEISRPNALLVHQGKLLVGNTGDGRLKAVDLMSKAIVTVAALGPGNIDGIKVDRDGNYLVSHWEGRIFRITPSGGIEKLLDTTLQGRNLADFAYLGERDLLIVPTFAENRLVGYRLGRS